MSAPLPRVVWADFGDEVDGVKGEIAAFLVKGAHEFNGETKYGVQAPNGKVIRMALVEKPSGGMTFRYRA